MKVIKKCWKAMTAALACAVLSFTAVAGYAPTTAQLETQTVKAEAAASLALNNPYGGAKLNSTNNAEGAVVMGADRAGIRYLPTDLATNAECTAGTYAWYNVLKFGIGTQDLSEFDSLEVDVYVHHRARASYWLVDADGDTARFHASSHKDAFTLTHESKGVYTATAYEWQGVRIEEKGLTTVNMNKAKWEANKNTFVNAGSSNTADGGISSTTVGNGTFDWNKVAAVMLIVRADNGAANGSYFDVTDIRKVKGTEKTSVFDVSNATQKDVSTKSKDLAQNEYALGRQDYVTATSALSAKVEKVEKGDFQIYRFDETLTYADNYVWTMAYVKGKTVNDSVDLSAYDAISFEFDSTSYEENFPIDFEIKTTANVAYRLNTAPIYYLMDEGHAEYGYYLSDTNPYAYKADVKAKVIIPLSQFNNITTDALKAMVPRIAMIVQANKVGTLKIDNVQFISNYEELVAPYEAIDNFALSFNAIEGAFIRSAEPAGIRFGATASATAYNNLVAMFEEKGVTYEFGTIIVPTGYAQVSPHAQGLLTIKATDAGMRVGAELMEFYGAMVNIRATNYNRKFTAYSYLQFTMNGVTNTIYANKDADSTVGYDRSIYELAVKAKENGYTNTYLQGIIDAVEAAD